MNDLDEKGSQADLDEKVQKRLDWLRDNVNDRAKKLNEVVSTLQTESDKVYFTVAMAGIGFQLALLRISGDVGGSLICLHGSSILFFLLVVVLYRGVLRDRAGRILDDVNDLYKTAQDLNQIRSKNDLYKYATPSGTKDGNPTKTGTWSSRCLMGFYGTFFYLGLFAFGIAAILSLLDLAKPE